MKHITSRNNYLSDSLSRLKIDQFFRLAPATVSKMPEKLPVELWPLSRLWQVFQKIIDYSYLTDLRHNRRLKADDTGSNSGSSSISTSEIMQVIDRLKHDRIRNTTQKNYYAIWKIFNQFIVRLDVKPTTWEQQLTLFVGHLVNTNRKSQTIKSYISAIKLVLIDGGIGIDEDTYLLMSLTKACWLRNDRVVARLPIYKDF